jgi:5-phospho-D-xylono-1,4-lactonase
MGGGVVMTVTGPQPASSLGVTDAHDHLFMRSSAMPGDEFEDLERSTAEVREAMSHGLQSLVEMTPIGLGRRPELLRGVAEATGLAIVAATGFHRDTHYPAGHWVHDASIETLAERIVTEIEVGMDPSASATSSPTLDPARAGAIKAGASYHHISPSERRRLEAAAIGSRRTGAAILVHTEIGTAGHDILDLLEGAGVAPDRIILSHLDRNPDVELHVEIASRGVTLEYNTLGRTKYHPDSVVLDLITGVVTAGHGPRLMLGCDLGRRSSFRAYGGGPGIAYLLTTFVPRLRRRIGDAATDAILVDNPARVYALAGAPA